MRIRKEPNGSFFYFSRRAGFTLPELIAVIVIMSILAFVALPRLWGSTFDQERLYDETLAALRYAQRSAVTYQRTVCVNFPSATQLTLSYSSAYSPPSCDTALRPPTGASQYEVNAPGSTSYSSPAGFSFNLLGVPSGGAHTITITGGKSIIVEADSGYVH